MQEARGTARALREEVSQLKNGQERVSDPAPPVETMLDALDGAIEMMSALDGPSAAALGHGKDRRGRIDIATLLFDIAPNAKIAIEPGAGTEVFGVENELRRVLTLLIKQSGSDTNATAPIEVRREGDWVVVCVAIGPEGMFTRDLEHRWLNRMATRHSGRVELTGNVTRLYLPADSSSGQQEILQLRKELEQAQLLGAVYAKELAEAFGVAADQAPSVAPESRRTQATPLAILVSSSAAILRTLRFTTDCLRQDVTRLARVVGDQHELTTALNSRLVTYGELLTDLERISRLALDESPRDVVLAALLREVMDSADGRARRQGVTLSMKCAPQTHLIVRVGMLTLLVRSLLDQAIAATPRAGIVEFSVDADEATGVATVIRVVDGGPIIPDGMHNALLLGQVDPSTVGRPSGLSWITVGACSDALGLRVIVGESTAHRSEVRLITGQS
jgi:hypothetical protein